MSEAKNIKGFNYGYTLAKLDLDLAKSIIATIESRQNNSLSYFKEGVIQKIRENLNANTKEQNLDHRNDVERDMDI